MVTVGVIDVGSNTVRLLVASVTGRSLTVLDEQRAWARLGSEIAVRGSISETKLVAVGRTVAGFAREARRLGCERLAVVVTSPGRQAENRIDLVRRLESESGAPVRVLGRAEEASIAFLGATSSDPAPRETTAVIDVGGGSTQLAIGLPASESLWVRSIDVGSLRLTAQALDADPPGKKGMRKAKVLLLEHLDGFSPPASTHALAVGGSARALRRLVGSPKLGADELRSATRLCCKHPSRELADRYGLDRERAATLPAGAMIVAEIQKRLDLPLVVARGGLREGAVLMLGADRLAA